METEAQKTASRRYRARHKERIRERRKRAYAKNAPLILAKKKEEYAKNPEKFIHDSWERSQALRSEIGELKERSPCEDCGGKFPAVCMDFDHLRGKIKSVSSLISSHASRDKVFEEIAKCDLVCSNCHRIRTQQRVLEKIAARKNRLAAQNPG